MNSKLDAIIEEIIIRNDNSAQEMDWTDHTETQHSDDGYCALFNG